MDQQLLDQFKRILHLRRGELTQEVTHIEADLHGLSEDNVSDWSDHAQEECTKAELAQLNATALAELGEIELALQRVTDHRYGICEHCEAAIPQERLRTLPTIRVCAECAQRMETAEA